MNIFEGSRRIAYFIGFMAIIGTLIYAFNFEPYVQIKYSISAPKAKLEKNDLECPSSGDQSYFYRTTESGVPYTVNLCLLPIEFGQEKQLLIPYKIENDSIWGAAHYSSEVNAYRKNIENSFVLPLDDRVWIEKRSSNLYWKNWGTSIFSLILGLIAFFGFTWVLGWILRGFLGIPRGMDKKPKTNI